MNRWTVIYSEYRHVGSHRFQETKLAHVTSEPGKIAIALEAIGVDLSQVTHVFHGHCAAITSDWSKL